MKLHAYFLATTFGVLGVSSAWAQDPSQQPPPTPSAQQPTQPVQPSQPANSPNGPDNPQEPVPTTLTGDVNNPPLAGAEVPSLKMPIQRSYLLPSLNYFGQADSNPSNSNGQSGFGNVASINTFLGGIDVQKATRRSQMNLGYLGGYSFSNQGGQFNSATHEFAISETFNRSRWDGFLLDEVRYSSQASYFGGVTPFDIAGLNDNIPIFIHSTFLPGQSILTNFGSRLSEVAIGQLDNHLTRNTSITFVGNYSTLHFFNNGLIDTSAGGFQVGLNHRVDRRNTVAVLYRFNDLWFSGQPEGVRDNIVLFAFQHEIGARLVFQAGAGPEISLISDTNGVSTTRNSWTADAVLRYQFRRMGFSASYGHFLTGGSGVFLGAITDLASAGVSRELSRVWSVSSTVSYGHNQNLIPIVTATTNLPAGATFNTVFGGIEFHRTFGRTSQLFFGYLARYQTSNSQVCLGVQCSNLVGHQFNLGIRWRPNPIPID